MPDGLNSDEEQSKSSTKEGRKLRMYGEPKWPRLQYRVNRR